MDFNRESLQNSIRDEKTQLAVHIHHQNLRLDMNRNSRFFHFSLIFWGSRGSNPSVVAKMIQKSMDFNRESLQNGSKNDPKWIQKSMDFNRESLKKSSKNQKTRLAVQILHQNEIFKNSKNVPSGHPLNDSDFLSPAEEVPKTLLSFVRCDFRNSVCVCCQ